MATLIRNTLGTLAAFLGTCSLVVLFLYARLHAGME